MNTTAVLSIALEDDVKDYAEGLDSKGNHKKGNIPFLWRDCAVFLARAPSLSVGAQFWAYNHHRRPRLLLPARGYWMRWE